MGLRMESGGRRSQAAVIPRCGPGSPFKGHLSTKSNAFCIDSCRSLTSQYLIRDHMVFHYNRILSAKAAVDCSVPKSRLTSIKFADQQRREKLKKKIARCEEKMSVCETVSQSSSRDSRRFLPSSFGKFVTCYRREMKGTDDVQGVYDNTNSKDSLSLPTGDLCSVQAAETKHSAHLQYFLEAEDKDSLCPCAGQAQYLSRALSPYGERGSIHSSAIEYASKCSQNTSKASVSSSRVSISRPPRNRSGLSCSHSTDSFGNISHSQRCQGSNSKECSGDLLEKHSKYFTKSRKPFTPRTLISDAKSFLSQYRYYHPAQRKKRNHSKRRVEAQTQTDVIRFSSVDKVSGRKVVVEQQRMALKAEDRRNTVDEPHRRTDACPYSILRETSLHSKKSSPRRTVKAQEEELLYLNFLEDVTNEILSLGLFSNRALEQLFECHIEANKNRLDESKMRHILDALKKDLGCGLESEAEQIHGDLEASDSLDLQEFDTMEELEFTSKGHRLRKATKSEELFRTMDLPLKEPNKCESLLCREMSKETQSIEDFSEDMAEMMDSATESDSYVKSEYTSPTCEATLNLITCDSDLEVSKELDDLEESFAEALQISHDYA